MLAQSFIPTAKAALVQSYRYLRSIDTIDYSAQFIGIPKSGPYAGAKVHCDDTGSLYLVIGNSRAYIDSNKVTL